MLGLSGVAALPLAAVADSCSGTTSVVCVGSYPGGISLGGSTLSVLVQNLISDITPASGTDGISVAVTAGDGTHNGAGDSGTTGGAGPNLTLTTTSSSTYKITVTGDDARGIFVRSSGGEGGNGGDGALGVVSAGSGGGGGAGGNISIDNSMGIATGGARAAGIWGLSQGGQGGLGGDDFVGSGGGGGGPGGNAGSVGITNHGGITTTGSQSFGIFGQSIGGNGGQAGGSTISFATSGAGGGANKGGSVTITNDGIINTGGDDSHGIFGESVGGFGGAGGGAVGLLGFGSSGSTGGDGGDVSITNHNAVTTTGARAYGIFAQSVGGGGGNGGSGVGIVGLGAGGSIGGQGGNVTVNNSGVINTSGTDSRGIFAQSVGGGGGNGGAGAGIAGVGGSGSGTSPGGNVNVMNSGAITTLGLNAHAIEAQSVGGGGGDGGLGVGIISIGGSGGAGGDAGLVTISNSGVLSTAGSDAAAIFAQSVGGGGGNGGNAFAIAPVLTFALGGSGGPGGKSAGVSVSSQTGSITTSGDRSGGISAQSIGGGGGNGGFAISASAGPFFSAAIGIGGAGSNGGAGGTAGIDNKIAVTTGGANATALFAQSIGGGGGNGGFALALAASDGIAGSFAVGGNSGGGGGGDAVTLKNTGKIITTGLQSGGILAQSIGGGGGNGGLAVSGAASIVGSLGFGIGGDGGSGGFGSAVNLTNSGDVSTGGATATAILAQSIGGGGGNGGGSVSGSFAQSASFSVGVGGKGDTGGNAAGVTLNNDGGATTTGDNAMGVAAQSIGGGGGNGGFAVTGTFSEGFAAGISVGGGGNGGGAGGTVSLTGGGTVDTSGTSAIGILAQSLGGGGGNGGFAIGATIAQDSAASFSIGGNAALGGAGGDVTINTTSDVTTRGDLAYGILAQSIGGGGGTGGFAITGQVSGGSAISGVSLALGGLGGGGGVAGAVSLTSGGDIMTSGQGAHGVMAQSIGGGGGDGGFAGSFVAALKDGATANFGVGGNGGTGNNGNIVTVDTSGTVTTTGQGAYGIMALSQGGGGGDGGWGMAISGGTAADSNGTLVGAIGGNGGTGNKGGAVNLTNTADVTTLGSNSYGIAAQSIGGGGGNGGFSASGSFNSGSNSKTLAIGVGGQGGGGNDAGTVTVTNSGKISTTGNTVDLTSQTVDNSLDKTNAIGILAQSIGGGGGDGGATFSGVIGGIDAKSLTVNVGGFGGAGGVGNDVLVTNQLGGSIETEGSFAYGIQAQSIGGGGGNGGMALSAIFGLGGEGTNVNAGITIGGQGGDANTGGKASISNAAGITTRGTQSAALVAQSIGGGGGTGGAAITAIMGVTSQDPSQSKSRTVNVTVAVGGLGGNGSNGGAVSVSNSGALTTWAGQSQGILAQSIGGGGGAGGNSNTISLQIAAACTIPVVCKTPDSAANNVNLQATVGGNGGGASDGGAVDVINSGAIVTNGELADGILAQSIGGGGGLGGNGSLGTGGLLPFPVETVFIPIGTTPIYQDINVAVGGNAGSSGNGGVVTVNNSATIFTSGGNASAIQAQSVGGGGGAGGLADIGVTGKVGVGGAGGSGGDGGTVSVTNQAALTTSGVASYGIFAQSIGGGGGRAGNVNRGLATLIGEQYGFGIGLAFGQGGGDGGDGAAVMVDNQSSVSTTGIGARGIYAQSVGGGGGQLGNIGNFDVPGLLGWFVGSNGDKGNAGDVTVTSGSITTQGSGAVALFAQSAGGQGTGDAVKITLRGSITTTGADSGGVIAQSAGLNGAGNITISGNGNITTSGDNATAMLAQSLGAATAQGIAGKAGTSVVASVTNPAQLPFLSGIAVGGAISIDHTGVINTSGANSHGIVAQSVSSMGAGGAVTITFNGSITAAGQDADGIMAQSTGLAASPTTPNAPFPNLSPTAVPNNGDIAITINGQGTVSGGLGAGAAIRFIDGNNNTLVNNGTLTTAKGVDGVTVIGGSGNETFDNYGTLIGQIDLGGGTNIFRNHAGATLAIGAVLNLNGATLSNDAILSPGNVGAVITTALAGSYSQSASGTYLVDLDLNTLTADRLNASGSASLAGSVTVNLDNIPKLRAGITSVTVMSAQGGITDAGVHLTNPSTAVASYSLTFQNATDAVVTLNVNYAPTGAAINANDTAIGSNFNAIQAAGSSTALAPTIQTIFGLPDAQSLHNFYQSLSPEPFLVGQQQVQAVGANLADAMLSCHPAQGGAFRFTDEEECSWLRVTPRDSTITANAAEMGSKSRAVDFALGHQFRIDDTFRVGLAGGYSTGTYQAGSLANGHGDSYAGGVALKAMLEPIEIAAAFTGGVSINHLDRTVAPGTVAVSRQVDGFLNQRLRAAAQISSDQNVYFRPFLEVNVNEVFAGTIQESGAGPLDLIADSSRQVSATAGVGWEAGGEINLGDFLLRPFLGIEFKHTLLGRRQFIEASFEGAPAGVAPFDIRNSPDADLFQPSVGFDLLNNQNWNLRILYTGTFGDTTRQDSYSLKASIPF